MATLSNNNSNTEKHLLLEDSQNSIQTRYNSVQYNLTYNVASNTQNANNRAISSVYFGPIAPLSDAKFTTKSIKPLEEVENIDVASLMHKHLSSSAGTTDYFYAFEK